MHFPKSNINNPPPPTPQKNKTKEKIEPSYFFFVRIYTEDMMPDNILGAVMQKYLKNCYSKAFSSFFFFAHFCQSGQEVLFQEISSFIFF